MTFLDISRTYVHRVFEDWQVAQATGDYTPELSFRPALNGFFENLANLVESQVSIIHEPSAQGRSGHPDWKFFHPSHRGVYGFVEAKGLSPTNVLDWTDHLDQIRKYAELNHKLILTDGIDFLLFLPESDTPLIISLLAKPLPNRDWASLPISPRAETLFREFLQDPGRRNVNEEQLIAEVAARAHEIARAVHELADLPVDAGVNAGERNAIVALAELKSVLLEHHDPTFRDNRVFADFVAQVLSFGLLYAHRISRTEELSPSDSRARMLEFWFGGVDIDPHGKLAPFRALVKMLEGELLSLGPLGTWYSDTADFLAYVRLRDSQVSSPDYHNLFERFLSVYDPTTRFDYGAFYTPHELAGFAVHTTKETLKILSEERSLYDAGNKLIDPCCGTGTFIEQLILQGEELAEQPYIAGLEILPAPYALANLRKGNLESNGKALDNVSIILTNTLSDELEEAMADGRTANIIEQEQNKARAACAPPLTLIIGNPPSVESKQSTEGSQFRIIDELLNDFRPPEDARTARQNIQKQVTNEFMKFLRWLSFLRAAFT